MGLVSRGFRKRPGRATMMTAAVAVAVALLVALQSVAAGFLAAQTADVRDRSVDVVMQPVATRGDPQETGLRAAGIQDARRLAADVNATPGVESAAPVLEAVVFGRVGDGNATAILAQGVIPAEHVAAMSEAQKARFDGWFSDAQDPPRAAGEVVVNRALAVRQGLARNGTLLLAASPTDPPVEFRVVGVFETPHTGTGILGGSQIVILHLSELQDLTGNRARDAATRLALRLDDATREDPDATEALLATLRARHSGYDLLTKEDELQDARERAAVAAGFYTAVAYVSLVVSALFVASVMIMEVHQRRRDLGVLRAIGWSRPSLFRAVAAEALAFVALGTLVGVVLGYFASEALGAYFQRGYGLDTPFTAFTWTLAAASAAQSLVVGVLAALWPAWQASRVDALQVIRRSV